MVSKTQFFGQINNSTEGLFFDSISTPVSSIELRSGPFFQDPRHQLGLIKGLSISFGEGAAKGSLNCHVIFIIIPLTMGENHRQIGTLPTC